MVYEEEYNMFVPMIFVVAMVIFLPFYIWTEYNWPQEKYLYMKLTSSLLFVLTGVTSLIVSNTPLSYGLLILIALVLGMIGDGFLVYDKHPTFFLVGLVSFLIGQVVYGTAFLRVNGFMWYDLLIYFALLGFCIYMYPKTKIKLEDMTKPVLLYYIIILFMFTMAISSIYKGGFNQITTILVSVGASLFLISDVILTFNLFDKTASKSIKIYVLVAYYFAQAMLALSILTYAL